MNQKSDNNGAGMTVAAGIAGAVVGAGAAIAATKVMSDKNMRDKVTGVLTDVKDKVVDAMEASHINGVAQEVAKSGVETAKKEIKNKS